MERPVAELSTNGLLDSTELLAVTELVELVVWRIVFWVLRILWLPLLVAALVYYAVLPALAAVAEALLTPSGLLLGLLVLLWIRRR